MRKLLIMRHAKSSWDEAGVSDHDRSLNARGKSAAPRMGQLMAEQRLRPDIMLSSTAKRARKTAKKVAAHCGCSPEIKLLPELYLASHATYLETLQLLPEAYQCVLVVGHNPGLEQLLNVLTGVHQALPTAALAVVELDLESWSELNDTTKGRLANCWLPREL